MYGNIDPADTADGPQLLPQLLVRVHHPHGHAQRLLSNGGTDILLPTPKPVAYLENGITVTVNYLLIT
jgi:hypothetical protein